MTVTGPFLNGLTGSYSSSGLSLGLDYQFALTDSLSLNPFLMTSGESVSNVNNVTATHGILGLQLRYWIGDAFVGGHLASYSETLKFGNTGISANASGGGAGLVAGWENPNGGLYVLGQLDSAKLGYANTDTKFNDVRLSVGYRWK